MQIELTKHEEQVAEAALVMLWQAKVNMRTLRAQINNRLCDMAPNGESQDLQELVDSLDDWISRINTIREEYSEAME